MDNLIKIFPQITCSYPLSKLTTLQIGGETNYFIEVKTESELKQLMDYVTTNNIKYYIIGEGSNLIAPDEGYNGLLIKIKIEFITIDETIAEVGSGNNLLDFIFKLNQNGLSGLEKMAGIPGSVGGAIYGNAGAYGQETKDHLVSARFYKPPKDLNSQGEIVEMVKSKLEFDYRSSIFKKHKDWLIISAKFKLKKADPKTLLKISQDTIKLREQKYHPGLRCPGSFFKNIIIDNLSQPQKEILFRNIDQSRVQYGKLPSGYLLELVGAKGMRIGDAVVADYHGNLIYNQGNATAADLKQLASLLKEKVYEKFGITLQEEVQYLEN